MTGIGQEGPLADPEPALTGCVILLIGPLKIDGYSTGLAGTNHPAISFDSF